MRRIFSGKVEAGKLAVTDGMVRLSLISLDEFGDKYQLFIYEDHNFTSGFRVEVESDDL